jgi:malonyl-CoA/methylmalonyl-CoA synthetase
VTAATLAELFAAGRPDDPAAILLDVPGGRSWSYGEAWTTAGRVAAGLRAAGATKGERVAARLDKSPEAVVLYLACVRAGAVFLPMNPAYTPEEVAYLLGDARPAVVVDTAERVRALAGGGAGAGDGDTDVGPDDPAALLYTSGTTGRPKGAVLSHRNLASNAETLRRVWGFRPDDVLLHALPVFHAHGLFVALGCVLANGTPAIFLPRFDVDQVLEQLPRSTVLMGVPTHYARLLQDGRLTGEACRHVRLFVSGSAPMTAALHDAFRERTGHAVLERYGMTETVMLTSNPLDGTRRPGSVGPPLPGVEVRIAEPDRTGVGGVEVRGPNVFAGYWGRPRHDPVDFTPDGWFRTGDLGRFDEDGYLHLVGRSKDLVISGGLNVYPKEVEAVLDRLPGVVESAVVGLPDDDLGEIVVAAVVAEGGAPLDPAALRDGTRPHLAGFKVPKRVVVVDELPRNAMGKVEKAVLRRRLTDEST